MDTWKKVNFLKYLGLASSMVSEVPLITLLKIVLMYKDQVLSANACAMQLATRKINTELEH